MRKGAAITDGTETYITYKNEGMQATAIEVGAIAMDNWGFDVAIYGRAGEGEWVAIEYAVTDRVDIGCSNPAFKQAIATAAIPEGITEVKVALTNTGAAWTMALNYVNITWDIIPTEVVVRDDLDNMDLVASSEGYERFGNHPEMGQSVVMRKGAAITDGTETYITYKNEGMIAKAIEVGAIAMDNWGFDVAIYGLNAEGEWVAIEYAATDRVDIGCSNAAFKQAIATATISESYSEIKVALTNTGAAWTMALNYVSITWDIA